MKQTIVRVVCNMDNLTGVVRKYEYDGAGKPVIYALANDGQWELAPSEDMPVNATCIHKLATYGKARIKDA